MCTYDAFLYIACRKSGDQLNISDVFHSATNIELDLLSRVFNGFLYVLDLIYFYNINFYTFKCKCSVSKSFHSH